MAHSMKRGKRGMRNLMAWVKTLLTNCVWRGLGLASLFCMGDHFLAGLCHEKHRRLVLQKVFSKFAV